jgi:hypothetical protein
MVGRFRALQLASLCLVLLQGDQHFRFRRAFLLAGLHSDCPACYRPVELLVFRCCFHLWMALQRGVQG